MILIGFRAQRKHRAKNVQIPVVLTLRADYEASVTVIKISRTHFGQVRCPSSLREETKKT